MLVEGRARPKSFSLAGGEQVEVDLAGLDEIPAEGPPVPVRYEDDRLLVVAKPAGLVTHPTSTRRSGTLVNRLLGMAIPLSSSGGTERRGIVHRLDAGTSGLLLVAKDDEMHAALADMLSRHEVDRRYLALVRGSVEHDRFSVEAPLGRRRARILVRRGSGREAETAFEVRERFGQATLLEAAPRTGRTHQIRVHLAALGHPVAGDSEYGGREASLVRPMLHAWRLRLRHPRTGSEMNFEAPPPPDFAAFWESLA